MPIPNDINGNPIPVLSLMPSGGHTLAATTGAVAKNAVPFDPKTQVVAVYAKTDVWIAFGEDDTVDAPAGGAGVHFFPAGIYYDFGIGNFRNQGSDRTDEPQKRYVAVRAATANGAVYLSEKE